MLRDLNTIGWEKIFVKYLYVKVFFLPRTYILNSQNSIKNKYN